MRRRRTHIIEDENVKDFWERERGIADVFFMEIS
jgi:hypothetical protein